MNSLPTLLGFNLLLAVAVMVTVWFVSLRMKDVSIVDIAWGATGALMAVSSFNLADGALSRHPNYFGDSLLWWGIFLVAAATPYGWVTVFSPILMTFFLMKVSGVPLLEKALAKRRSGYREYIERTSPFFPWPPRKRVG